MCHRVSIALFSTYLPKLLYVLIVFYSRHKARRSYTMQTQITDFTPLRGAKYISLTTFRKSGEPVATPVWFAQDNDVLYLFTFPGAGKLKRIRHTARVTVAPCTLNGKVTGPSVEGKARILTETQEEAFADQALAKKYGVIWHSYNGLMGALLVLRRRPKPERVYVAIVPAET